MQTQKSSKRKSKEVYFNDKQIAVFEARQPMTVNIWGRGTGKSVVGGAIEYDCALHMPRAKRFICSKTYKQLLTNILPAIKSKWLDFGLIQDKHYIVGRKPPSWYDRPYAAPDSHENIISFFNGFALQLMSMDNANSQRGGSFDGGMIDEMAFIPRDKLNQTLLPSVRGNINRFSHWRHQQVNCFTSMPWKAEGQYVLDYAEKAKINPDQVYYSEANVYDNIVVLGQKGIDNLRNSMTTMEFEVEVLNKHLTKLPEGFYPSFDPTVHTFEAPNEYGIGESGIYYAGSKAINNRAPIDLTFDFGGWFNCCIAFQEQNDIEYAINSFYVKDAEKLDTLVNNFCDHYAGHGLKHVNIYGEPRGHDRMATAESLFAVVLKILRKRGWSAELKVENAVTDQHALRHEFIVEIMEESNDNLPKLRFEEEECKAVIYAIQMTGIKPDFKKDKSSERKREYKQEHATHFTDGMDYFLMQKYYHRVDMTIDEYDNWTFF